MPLAEPEWVPEPVRDALQSQGRGLPTVDATVLVQVSRDTGAKPVLFVADDRRRYWAKWPGNPHGNLSLAHEWIVSSLGRVLGAPIPEGALVYVEASLVADCRVDGRRLPGGVWFGSSVVNGIESTAIELVARDGNADRIPRYLALWLLCLGCDAQFIYDGAEDDRVWSIDHGLWFNSLEGEWTRDLLRRCKETHWTLPDWQGSRNIDPGSLHGAADAVEALTSADLASVAAGVPVEWEVSDAALEQLAEFVHGRRPVAAAQLRALAAGLDGRRP